MKQYVAIHAADDHNIILSDVDYLRLKGLVDIIEEGLDVKFDWLDKKAAPKLNVVNMYGSPQVRYDD